MANRAGMEAVSGKELLAARAKRLVDVSAGTDVHRARGWVGGSTLAALVGGASQAEHRLQCGRDPRHDRQIDQPADHGLDSRSIQRADHRAKVALELHERRRVDGVVGPNRYHRDIGTGLEHGRQLVHQHIGDP